MTVSVKGEPHQQLLTTFLGQLVDLYAVLTQVLGASMTKIDAVAEDEGLKESIGRYAINIGSITEQVYRKEMAEPIEDMKQYLTVSSTFTMKGGQRDQASGTVWHG